jgi:hypothetical protein
MKNSMRNEFEQNGAPLDDVKIVHEKTSSSNGDVLVIFKNNCGIIITNKSSFMYFVVIIDFVL